MAKYCKYCGNEINPSAKFCRCCGKQLKVTIEERTTKLVNDVRDLFVRLQGGDMTAFDELYDTTYQYVYFSIQKKGVEIEADIKDILQDVYCKVYMNYASVRNPQVALAWMKHITFNATIDYLRKKNKSIGSFEEITDSNEAENKDMTVDDQINIPEYAYENKEFVQMIRSLISELSQNQQKVLFAYYYDEMKTGEIAEAYNIPESTVKTWLSRAREKLKGSIENMEKKTGTRYHIIPFALFFTAMWNTEAKAAEINMETYSTVKHYVKNSVALSNMHSTHVDKKKIAAKTTKMSLKTKMAIGIGTVITAGTIGGATYINTLSLTPEKAIENFESAYNSGDVDGVVDCLDEDAQKVYKKSNGLLKKLFKTDAKSVLKDLIDITNVEPGTIDLEVVDVQIDGNESIVECDISINGEYEDTDMIELVKEGLEWHIKVLSEL